MFKVTQVSGWGAALAVAGGMGAAAGASAAELAVTVEVPRLTVAEYHKPYVAGWIETANGAHAGNLFVWYDVKMKDEGGKKWLKDMRAWWRKSGRSLTTMPDGLASATKAPGRQTVNFTQANGLKGIKPGQYNLVIEASREAGGLEIVRVPLNLTKASNGSGKGASELGAISYTYKP